MITLCVRDFASFMHAEKIKKNIFFRKNRLARTDSQTDGRTPVSGRTD